MFFIKVKNVHAFGVKLFIRIISPVSVIGCCFTSPPVGGNSAIETVRDFSRDKSRFSVNRV